MQDDTMSARDGALPDTGEREVWTPEPDTFDPAVACPGGCGHLDAPCARGECTLTGCVAAATVNRACDDGDPCTI
ncbi:MAG: hypothetical protein KC621_08065, partial [Myxococcales bacterium]|nr:hypothetical protein [Myxococcales bacterium]